MNIKKSGRQHVYHRLTAFWILFLSSFSIYGQISFQEASLLPDQFYTALPVAITDVNNDLRDDVVILDQRQFLYVAYQENRNKPFNLEFISDLGFSGYWSVAVADMDKNGERDILLGSEFAGLKVFYQEDGNWRKDSIPSDSVFGQAMNIVDINSDGWPDVFLCNDIGHNAVFINEAGTLKQDTSYFRELTSTDAAGNYGSVWSDYDLDGDLDLYLAKCFAGAGPGDLRRINILYENNDGTFSDIADEVQLNTDDQSWTGDFLDINNDGVLECLVTNHDAPCSLYELMNGRYQDISIASGFNFESTVIQNVNEDFNHDGYIDLFLTGQSEIIYQNQRDGTFDFIPNPFDPYYRMNTGITGDLNYDGAVDIYATYGQLITGNSSISDRIYLNQTQTGRYLDVYLVGTESNPDAIGARVEIFGSWGVQVREVKAGQSYGIQNSLVQRFGTGPDRSVDSLKVYWPSGLVQSFMNIPTNNYFFCVEGIMYYTPGSTYRSFICEGETTTLSTPKSYPIEWNDGDTSRTREVGVEGFYQPTLEVQGNRYTLPGYEVIIDDVPEVQITSDDECLCKGDSLWIKHNYTGEILWNTGQRSREIRVDQGGPYFVSFISDCGDLQYSDTLFIEEKTSPGPIGALIDTAGLNDTACLVLTGDSILWYDSEDKNSTIARGDTLKVLIANKDTSFFASNISTYLRIRDTLGPAPVDLDTTLNQVNRELFFEVSQPTILHSVEVYAETEGPRLLEIKNPRRQVIYSDSLYLMEGENIWVIDTLITPDQGLFRMGANTDFNQKYLGTPTPQLLFKKGLLPYPFEFENNLSIYYSSFSTTQYHYFFNWDVEQVPLLCESELVKVEVVMDTTTQTHNPKRNVQRIFPNPGRSFIEFDYVVDEVQMINAHGQVCVQSKKTKRIETGHLPPGNYYIQLRDEKGDSYWLKWIKP